MKKLIGALLLLAGLALFELCVFHLVQVGSCQSGGPQAIANECPHSTWTWLPVTLPALILGLIGAGMLNIVSQVWTAGWILSGIVAIVAVYSPGDHTNSHTGGIVIAVVWIGLGLMFAFLTRSGGKAKAPG
jgi:hypothetical protein